MRILMIALGLMLFAATPGFAQVAQPRAWNAAQTRQLLADKTNMSFSAGHGTQVEFTARDGSSYLVYPGNRNVLKGHWKLQEDKARHTTAICFIYGPNSYNPVTRQRGGWECAPAAIYAAGLVEQANGDLLGLAKAGPVPFQLSHQRTTLKSLAGKPRR
jgi:hypothetical protein